MSEQGVHEQLAPSGVNTKRVTLAALGAVLFLGVSMSVLALVFFALVPTNRSTAPREFPQPQLQAHSSADLQQYLSKQRSALNRYRWANSDHRLIAIPIERAMAIIAERGAKGYDPIATTDAGSLPPPGARP